MCASAAVVLPSRKSPPPNADDRATWVLALVESGLAADERTARAIINNPGSWPDEEQ